MANKPRPPRKNPLLGKIVLWYPRAERQSGARPALVTGPQMEHRELLLSLTVFEEHGRFLKTERNVRHVDDPILEERPRMREQGGWEEIPNRDITPARSTKKEAE